MKKYLPGASLVLNFSFISKEKRTFHQISMGCPFLTLTCGKLSMGRRKKLHPP
jgi:hypothetical protein